MHEQFVLSLLKTEDKNHYWSPVCLHNHHWKLKVYININDKSIKPVPIGLIQIQIAFHSTCEQLLGNNKKEVW